AEERILAMVHPCRPGVVRHPDEAHLNAAYTHNSFDDTKRESRQLQGPPLLGMKFDEAGDGAQFPSRFTNSSRIEPYCSNCRFQSHPICISCVPIRVHRRSNEGATAE